MKKYATILLLCFMVCLQANTAIRYVSTSGAGLMNGTSWANALPGASLQAAITASIGGDEVWVMSGTYFTTTTADRNIYFGLVNGVAVYGSFNGTETAVSQRVFSCGFTSVLSAEIGAPGKADNSYHVMSNSSVTNTAILDGFTLTGANANFDLTGNDNRSLGGGMINVGSNGGIASPTIRNCLLTNNTALFGAGIFNHGQNNGNANPVITNCIITADTATSGGGGIDNFGYNGNASPIITNCIFYANVAINRAGAMYCWGGGNGNANPTVLNCVFVNNSAVDGGGIVADRSNFVSGNSGNANPNIRNSIFWSNTASGTGPQFFIIGGAGFAATYSCINIIGQNPPHAITGPGTGNTVIAPSFVNMANAAGVDNCWLTNDDGLQLQSGSAGIDAGNNADVPAFDIRNFNRVSNSVVDMGAYESNSTILPIRLIHFSGRAIGSANLLSWVTAAETNNYLFEIERSSNGILFTKIGELTAYENSSGLRQYFFTDAGLTALQYWYRLRQTGTDGNYIFSNNILLVTKWAKPKVTVNPNPVTDKATISFTQPLLVNETFLLYSCSGQLKGKFLINGNTGQVDLTGMAAGLYSLVNKKLGIMVKVYKVAK